MILTPTFYIKKAFEQYNNTPKEVSQRTELLHKIALKIVAEYKAYKKVNLNFICTHNSRRSQLAQTWCFFAIAYFNLKNIYPFSGGVSTTAFHRNTVKALQKAGFTFHIVDFSHQNPTYLISFSGSKKSILGFSKNYEDATNQQPYIAITHSEKANKNIAQTGTFTEHFYLPYEDPTVADQTALQNEKYLALSETIASEIFVIFEKVNKLLNDK